ncbi:LysR family transcriptional regulator [Tsukamurella sp. 8F]|uniref:LysR family transcriptional regulator n=1 Tax=unclassified Tsukamurella TaxID=2633480 RepID=UPI0023B9C5FA|nr:MULTISPECIES: LysR family transcriptional regulator [unclassified Tsukamurella]MDF0530998.1 LysR family transcriptional regulator [Tsukamurella sp. 8J]MDF0588699.1 LysR family transcriptional regulator [Tsukamurella sp. 8F]
MELHQLRYLIAVTDQGSFTAAADVLQVSQSGVSAQIGKLERELGHRLFQRGTRSVAPTAEGEQLLPYARAALRSVDDLRTAADELAGLDRGHVRLGTVIGCAIPGFLAGFAEFRHDHPAVTVEVTEGNSDPLVRDLHSGTLDVALVAHAHPLPDTLESRTLLTEPLVAVVPEGHPWTRRRAPITPKHLTAETILCLPPGTGVRAALDATCAAHSVALDVAVQAHSPDALLQLAAHGAGVTILSRSMTGGAPSVAISGSAPNHLSLATRTAPSGAARTLAATLLRHLTSR